MTLKPYCRPPPGKRVFLLGHFYFFCYHDDSADYPGFRLNEAARLDVMQRKEKGGGLLKRGEEGIRRERFSEGENEELISFWPRYDFDSLLCFSVQKVLSFFVMYI